MRRSSLTIIPSIFAGVPDFNYLWEYNGETSTSPQLDLSNIESDVEVFLEVTDSDDPNCSVSDTLFITISPTPTYTLDSIFIKCEGIAIDISFEKKFNLVILYCGMMIFNLKFLFTILTKTH